MSAVRAVNYLLSQYAPLIAVVPATRILTGFIPVGTVLPAVCVNDIGTVPWVPMSGAVHYKTTRVQVTVQSHDYDEVKSILKLVGDACPNQRGTVDTVAVDKIQTDSEGPDLRNDDANIHMKSRDFMVGFTE